MAIIHQKPSPESLVDSGTAIPRLVTGGCARIQAEFDTVFDSPTWAASFVDNVPMRCADAGLALAVEVNLHAAAAYHRRIVTTLSK
jgi:hypothetical protein